MDEVLGRVQAHGERRQPLAAGREPGVAAMLPQPHQVLLVHLLAQLAHQVLGVLGAALEGAVHLGRPRSHRAALQRWPLLVCAHPNLHRTRRRPRRDRQLLLEAPRLPRDQRVQVIE